MSAQTIIEIIKVIDVFNSHLKTNFKPVFKEVDDKMIIIEQKHDDTHLIIFTYNQYEAPDEYIYYIEYKVDGKCIRPKSILNLRGALGMICETVYGIKLKQCIP